MIPDLQQNIYSDITGCRSCASKELFHVHSFGATPLADKLIRENELFISEIKAPLTLLYCHCCKLLQLKETVEPEILFCQEYPYLSSTSPQLLTHFKDSAETLISELGLNNSSLVIEAASNDGYMLRNFKEKGIKCVGIDPSDEPVRRAKLQGIDTWNTFFSLDTATSLKNKYPQGCDLFLANNVLAHVANLDDFVAGISLALSSSGKAVIEVPYLIDLVEACEFDTIYHQHLCYFSIHSVEGLLNRHGLYINHIEHLKIHGGSLRIYSSKTFQQSKEFVSLKQGEKNRLSLSYYREFSAKIDDLAGTINQLLRKIKDQGNIVAGYGAAAKACTLTSVCGIDNSMIDYIADKNTYKQGKFMGGNHIPIYSPEAIMKTQPDYVFILAWNFSEEIMNQLSSYKNSGGKFIIPLPTLKIL